MCLGGGLACTYVSNKINTNSNLANKNIIMLQLEHNILAKLRRSFMENYGLYLVLSCIDFFYVGLRYLYETLNASFLNIICYEYQTYRPTFLRTTIFVTC